MSLSLDSWAILAWLEGRRPVAELIEEILEGRPSVADLSLAEAQAAALRHVDKEQVVSAIALIAACCSVIPSSAQLLQEGAACSASLGLPLTSAVALASARSLGQRLVTGDPLLLAVAGEDEVLALTLETVEGAP
jgi:predicted nucleic acid-binding protein